MPRETISDDAGASAALIAAPLDLVDDGLIHQETRLASTMGAGEKAWFEHAWMIFIPPTPDLPLIESLVTIHPNQSAMHMNLLILAEGRQYNLRAAREITNDRSVSVVGPMTQNTLAPFERWLVTADARPALPLTFHAEVGARTSPQAWPLLEYPNYRQQCVLQFGGVTEGQLDLDGEVYDLRDWMCVRDHCWGIRTYREGPALHTWLAGRLDDGRSIVIWHAQDELGVPLFSNGSVTTPGVDAAQWADHITIRGTFDGPTMLHAEWEFDLNGAPLILKTGEIPHLGIRQIGGWSGEDPHDHHGGTRFEAEVWDPDPRTHLAGKGRASLSHYYVPIDLDGVSGHAVLSYFRKVE